MVDLLGGLDLVVPDNITHPPSFPSFATWSQSRKDFAAALIRLSAGRGVTEALFDDIEIFLRRIQLRLEPQQGRAPLEHGVKRMDVKSRELPSKSKRRVLFSCKWQDLEHKGEECIKKYLQGIEPTLTRKYGEITQLSQPCASHLPSCLLPWPRALSFRLRRRLLVICPSKHGRCEFQPSAFPTGSLRRVGTLCFQGLKNSKTSVGILATHVTDFIT